MPLRDDLNSEVRKILQEPWQVSQARRAPRPEELDLDNIGSTIQAAVLYADLDESTKLVDRQDAVFAGQVYKVYLVTAGRVIRSEQGAITAYDGDRIMAVYTGRKICERAVRSAMKINYVVQEIINPAMRELAWGQVRGEAVCRRGLQRAPGYQGRDTVGERHGVDRQGGELCGQAVIAPRAGHAH